MEHAQEINILHYYFNNFMYPLSIQLELKSSEPVIYVHFTSYVKTVAL